MSAGLTKYVARGERAGVQYTRYAGSFRHDLLRAKALE